MKCLQLIVLAMVSVVVAWVPARINRGVAWTGNGKAVGGGRRKILSLQVKGVLSACSDGIRMSDEEEDVEEGEEEEEEVPTPNPFVEELPDISPYKEGIKFPTSLNGSDVRVGIIMARWNADVINGLYKGVNESLLGTCISRGWSLHNYRAHLISKSSPPLSSNTRTHALAHRT